MIPDELTSTVLGMVERLRRHDRRRAVFGAGHHRHAFGRPLAESVASAFEHRHGVTLPPDYRAYLTRLGNGGAGPYYGIFPLDPEPDDRHAHISRPFPHTQAWQPDEAGEVDELDDVPGTVALSEYGCGIFLLLVVHGAAYGQVWWDARGDGGGLSPVTGQDGSVLGFGAWLLAGIAPALELFEAVHARMASRTPHEEIHQELDRRFLSLDVDKAIASLLDQTVDGRARGAIPDKPWGRQCARAGEHYDAWLRRGRPALP